MGKVLTTITVINNQDITRAEVNAIQAASIRETIIENVIVDTGATTLCLPKKYIEHLGLPLSREVVVSTPTGEYVTKMYNNALLKIEGREALVEIIELHDDARPLLGVIPMEILGLEVDVIKHELRLSPDHTKDTYLMVY